MLTICQALFQALFGPTFILSSLYNYEIWVFKSRRVLKYRHLPYSSNISLNVFPLRGIRDGADGGLKMRASSAGWSFSRFLPIDPFLLLSVTCDVVPAP